MTNADMTVIVLKVWTQSLGTNHINKAKCDMCCIQGIQVLQNHREGKVMIDSAEFRAQETYGDASAKGREGSPGQGIV